MGTYGSTMTIGQADARQYFTLQNSPDPDGKGGESASVDPRAGTVADNGKPIWDLGTIETNLNRTGYDWYTDNYGVLDDGVLNYGFWSSYEQLASSYYVNDDGSIAFNEAYFADDFSVFTAAQIAGAQKSIGLWDDLVAIGFQQTDALQADLTYANTDTGGAQAYAYLPFGDQYDSFYAQFGFTEAGRLGGDVWIDGFVASNFTPLADSYYSITTLIHETGHALGLSHPGNYDALDDDDGDGVPDPISYENDAAFYQDSLQYSIMSYFDAYETGAQYVDWSLLNFAYPSTPQVHDVAAIQAIYGADFTTRAGDTVYGFNSTADRSAFDFTQNTRPVVTIWDGGGNDTLDFSGWATPSTIDLNEGAFSSGGGIEEFLTLEQVNANRAALGFAPRSEDTAAFYEGLKDRFGLTNGLFKDNIAIAYGAVIENAVGGSGDDLIIANQVANRLNGGRGSDTVSYEKATSGVTASLLTNTGTGGAAGDRYIAIENLSGSRFADTLEGSATANILNGGNGADTINGGRGDDSVDGGAGDDRIDGGNDKDSLNGDGGNDTIFGSSGSDRISGDAGDDRIYGDVETLTAGNRGLIDTLDGGIGQDIIYGDAYTLKSGSFGANDVVQGGGGNDTLYGDGFAMERGVIGGSDLVQGGAGDDILYGDARFMAAGSIGGSDRLEGGAGNDRLFGGGGSDTFLFNTAAFGNDVIGDFSRAALNNDVINLRGLGVRFADLDISYAGGNALITADEFGAASSILLTGITSLSANDFSF